MIARSVGKKYQPYTNISRIFISGNLVLTVLCLTKQELSDLVHLFELKAIL